MKKKKVISVIAAAAVTAAAVGGIGTAVRVTTRSSEINVYPAQELNYGWYSSSSTLEGEVTAEASQNVYISGTESVAEVHVAEGQTVKSGDLLLTYDTTKTAINLELQRLQKEEIELNIEAAERNLEKLNRTSPISEDGGYIDDGWYDDGDWEEWSDEEIDEEIEEETNPLRGLEDASAVVYAVLDGDSVPYNSDSDGSIDHPLRFLCTDGCKIEKSFISNIRSYGEDTYFLLEIRSGDSPSGSLKSAWVVSAAGLVDTGDIPDDWEGVLSLTARAAEEKGSEEQEDGKDASSQGESGSGSEDSGSGGSDSSGSGSEDSGISGSESGESGGGSGESTGEDGGSEDSGPAEENSSAEESMITGDVLPFEYEASGLAAAFGSVTVYAAERGEEEGSGYISSVNLLTGDLSYTKDELANAKTEMRDTLRDLELSAREADLKIASAEKALEDGEVRAQMDGVVKKVGDPEKPAADGGAFLTVTGVSGSYIRGYLPELMLDDVQSGDSVLVTSYQSGNVFTATISSVSDYPDTSRRDYNNSNSSLYPFTAYADESGVSLQNGDWVQISTMDTDLSESGELYLWKAFIREENGQHYVWIRNEDGTLKKQNVVTGVLAGEGYQILSGVTMDDYVAFPYGKGLRDGAKTRISGMDALYNY
ncbi:MAG: biotin/lipoyl-binding protein [Lachnospiraceae bacterium]|nr:biotin/lipoyl-binding protein [Lachnospiraceae bacterium]